MSVPARLLLLAGYWEGKVPTPAKLGILEAFTPHCTVILLAPPTTYRIPLDLYLDEETIRNRYTYRSNIGLRVAQTHLKHVQQVNSGAKT